MFILRKTRRYTTCNAAKVMYIDDTATIGLLWFPFIFLYEPAGKMKLEFLENPSSTLLGYSRISNLTQAHFLGFS